MFNPLLGNIEDYSDSEIEDKISELGRKYFLSNNPDVKRQISVVMNTFKEESIIRAAKQKLNQQENTETGENGLDNLINIS